MLITLMHRTLPQHVMTLISLLTGGLVIIEGHCQAPVSPFLIDTVCDSASSLRFAARELSVIMHT